MERARAKECFYCALIVDKEVDHITCVRCKITLHDSCYKSGKDNEKNYTECPSCARTGSLGTVIGTVNQSAK